MNKKEKKKWLETKGAKLFVAKEHFHHHAYEITKAHFRLKTDLTNCLNSKIPIYPRIKKTGKKETKGIKAKGLNIEIRNLLGKLKSEVKLEVNEEKGVFYFSSEKTPIGGFDFAILNHKKNILALRNICFGELHYHEGEKRWQKFLEKNKDLIKIAEKLEKLNNIGKDIEYEIDYATPLIVGEIQFGNWALAYRDFFKVLKANVQNSIDCLIYIVPTGSLEKMLSNSIVTFDNTVKIINEFAKVISVPVWVIGLDVK